MSTVFLAHVALFLIVALVCLIFWPQPPAGGAC